jgi:competence/damage-inducible protein CinA-like protein
MPSAEIITIGTELLLGEIVDTNSTFLARKLRDLGVDVFRTSTVGDNTQRIADVIRETLKRTQIVITTGGLGPTVDDPTRDAVALAMNTATEFRVELWDQIVERLQRFGRVPTENQKRQAYVPKGALAIKNPVGTAPAFIFEEGDRCIISLPGVPREMEYLTENTVLPYLRGRYQLTGTIKARLLHTAGVGESQIDEWVGEFEKQANPTVGLAAHSGIVDVRITAKADSVEQADEMIADLEKILRERLGRTVFGTDDDTLEGVTLKKLEVLNWSLAVVEVGMSGALIQRLSKPESPVYRGGESLPMLPEEISLIELAEREAEHRAANVVLAIAYTAGTSQHDFDIYVNTPNGPIHQHRSYGGHPRYAPDWAVNITLDMLRLAMD